MNGAESLVRTLVAGDVNVCFTNPGTSEMHFVAALDRVDGMRCVLGLFEGIVTGAADGYYRMLGSLRRRCSISVLAWPTVLPICTTPRRQIPASSTSSGSMPPIISSTMLPLTSDIEGIARPMSAWVRTSPDAKSIARMVGCYRRRQRLARSDCDAHPPGRYGVERSGRHCPWRKIPSARATRLRP